MLFLHIKQCSNKRQLANSWWLIRNILADYQNFTDCFVSLRRIFLTQNQIVNQANFFFRAGTLWSAATCESVDCVGV